MVGLVTPESLYIIFLLIIISLAYFIILILHSLYITEDCTVIYSQKGAKEITVKDWRG